MKLSVIIPVYNEKDTILKVVESVQNISLPSDIKEREIIVVDDFSNDGTSEVVRAIQDKNVVKIFHEKNFGKGCGVSNALKKVSGDLIIIQDADLEYNPKDFSVVLKPILENKADFVNGSRFLKTTNRNVGCFWHTLGNRLLTLVSNLMADIHLTDTHSCYKAFNKKALSYIDIQEQRFGVEAEMVAKVATEMHRGNLKVYEVPITYKPRGYNSGKKIKVKDLFRTFWCNFNYNTSRFAKLIKYLVNGTLLAGVQLLIMISVIELLNINTIVGENVVYASSIIFATIVAFFVHFKITWRVNFEDKNKFFNRFRMFLFVSFCSLLLRQFVFYGLSVLGVNYILNTFVGILILIIFNFFCYNKFVFNDKK